MSTINLNKEIVEEALRLQKSGQVRMTHTGSQTKLKTDNASTELPTFGGKLPKLRSGSSVEITSEITPQIR
jgi:hypothetical protein